MTDPFARLRTAGIEPPRRVGIARHGSPRETARDATAPGSSHRSRVIVECSPSCARDGRCPPCLLLAESVMRSPHRKITALGVSKATALQARNPRGICLVLSPLPTRADLSPHLCADERWVPTVLCPEGATECSHGWSVVRTSGRSATRGKRVLSILLPRRGRGMSVSTKNSPSNNHVVPSRLLHPSGVSQKQRILPRVARRPKRRRSTRPRGWLQSVTPSG